jgi:predicted nucleic-acid-binding Zn-ribbon protein
MHCKSCGSENLGKFTGEIAIHSSGLKNINKPHVFVFPELVVCLNCGFAEFAVQETELRLLTKGRAAGAE